MSTTWTIQELLGPSATPVTEMAVKVVLTVAGATQVVLELTTSNPAGNWLRASESVKLMPVRSAPLSTLGFFRVKTRLVLVLSLIPVGEKIFFIVGGPIIRMNAFASAVPPFDVVTVAKFWYWPGTTPIKSTVNVQIVPGSILACVITMPPLGGDRVDPIVAVGQFSFEKFGVALTFRFGSKLSANEMLVKGTLLTWGFSSLIVNVVVPFTGIRGMLGRTAGGENDLERMGGATTCTTALRVPAGKVFASAPTFNGPAVNGFIPAVFPRTWIVKVQSVKPKRLPLLRPTVVVPGAATKEEPGPQLPLGATAATTNPNGSGLAKFMSSRVPDAGLATVKVKGVEVPSLKV